MSHNFIELEHMQLISCALSREINWLHVPNTVSDTQGREMIHLRHAGT